MDFHPNMLASQWAPRKHDQVLPRGTFLPGMRRNLLSGVGMMEQAQPSTGTPIMATPGPAPAFGVDWASGTMNIGGNTIKLIPALLTAVAVKLVFFGGNQAAKGAKHLYGKIRSRGASPAAATNPGGRAKRSWKAVVQNSQCQTVKAQRCSTKAAAERFLENNSHLGSKSRVFWVGG